MKSQVMDALGTVSSDRHKLAILLGAYCGDKTALLKWIANEMGGKYVKLDLDLTHQLFMLPLSRYDGRVTVHALIDELCADLSPDSCPLMIDNVEALLSPALSHHV